MGDNKEHFHPANLYVRKENFKIGPDHVKVCGSSNKENEKDCMPTMDMNSIIESLFSEEELDPRIYKKFESLLEKGISKHFGERVEQPYKHVKHECIEGEESNPAPTNICDCQSEFEVELERLFNTIDSRILPDNNIFLELLGENVLLILAADQLNILGQTFRPIFCGKVNEVTNGYITLDPVIIKMPNAPFHRNPFGLSFPIEKISQFTPFDCDRRLPLT